MRRALSSDGYERVVLDFGNSGIAFYQLYIQSGMGTNRTKIIITLRGIENFSLQENKLRSIFHKSRYIDAVHIYPALEQHEAIVELELRKKTPIEVFELVGPHRLVLDLKVTNSV